MRTLSAIERNVFRSAADNVKRAGYDARLVKNYAGRTMYGRECIGVVTDTPRAEILFCVELGVLFTHWGQDETARDVAAHSAVDEMGRNGHIVYFSNLQWGEDDA